MEVSAFFNSLRARRRRGTRFYETPSLSPPASGNPVATIKRHKERFRIDGTNGCTGSNSGLTEGSIAASRIIQSCMVHKKADILTLSPFASLVLL